MIETFTLRPYQEESVDKTIEFLDDPTKKHGIVVLPTGSGKSLVIAKTVDRLKAPVLVFQPSKEILDQNRKKLISYGYRPAVYSAALGKKQISGAVTLATIGSVVDKAAHFEHVRTILIDECHGVNASTGMYKRFFDSLQPGYRIVGYTATPYRLASAPQGAILKFLTRTQEKVFSDVIHYVQNGDLFRAGHLAQLEYHQVKGFDRSKLKNNSTGADYTDKSIQLHFRELNFQGKLERVVDRLIEVGRKGILVFTRFLEESRELAAHIPGAAVVSAETPAPERDRILRDFREGKIRVVCNVGVLTTGFDYPELDTVVLARPTMSLGLYYQMVGRVVRPHPSKSTAWVVDMVGLLPQFGKVEDLRIERTGHRNKLFHVVSNGKPLTNIIFGKRAA